MRVIVVVAEKPSVARDLARLLGARRRDRGCLRGERHVVTWALGHLVTLGGPEAVDPRLRSWRLEHLPMLPRRWPLQVVEKTREQFEVVEGLLRSPQTKEVICATDAGREGELIFRYIAELTGLRAPVRRLWISSLTDEAIRKGLDNLRSAAEYDGLADAARGRSRADWLVGMNLSRLYTLRARTRSHPQTEGAVFSVGRVQTPTLAMLVERERAIRDFVPEDYVEVVAKLRAESGGPDACFEARYVEDHKQNDPFRFKPESDEAQAVCQRARDGRPFVHSVKREEKRLRPEPLYDLTELQRSAHRLYGLSAQRTLDLAQRLYEQHKLISYPRTDSRHLSSEVARELPAIVSAVRGPYEPLLEPQTGKAQLGSRFVSDAQVTDHHAIIPTGKSGRLAPHSDEQKLYDLIVRRLLAAYQSDYRWAATTLRCQIDAPGGAHQDAFLARGTTVLEVGFRRLDVETRSKTAQPATLPPLTPREALVTLDARCDAKRTRPPPHFTEASLLTAMETAGRGLEDRELSRAMRDRGLGTPATRAGIIETLLKRAFLRRDGKSLRCTEKAEALIDAVHPLAKSAQMTGEWEHRLRKIERGDDALPAFMRDIEAFVREVVGAAGTPAQAAPVEPNPARAPVRPAQAQSPEALLKSRFGLDAFRPHQQAVVEHLVRGDDALLVMPTGAGKSLCYQLPAVARGGTALVVSPLIALMDDQQQKLNAAGFRAERIHSGLSREAARSACRRYLRGELDFLFIAPERLRVPGFAELLAKHPPSLIAVDEAHCISQWGHDFRPDYRMLSERLPRAGGQPLVALTATATREVQDDIIAQLRVPRAARFTHGFRRENLALSVVEATPKDRDALLRKALSRRERRPAIVYAPTRALADELAQGLARRMRTESYHAGLPAAERERTQRAFLDGTLEVVVATIAFGMGIDKKDVRTVIHMASPATLESYYQEVGRAGRDGEPAQALMLCSPIDRRMHQFFFDRDYPEVSELSRAYSKVTDAPISRSALEKALGVDAPQLTRLLEILWVHGGIQSADGMVWRTQDRACIERYAAQRERRAAQLSHMPQYIASQGCRMLSLIHHFGDTGDGQRACGMCDNCQRTKSTPKQRTKPSPPQRRPSEKSRTKSAKRARVARSARR